MIIVWNFMGKLLYKLNGHLGCIRSLYIDDYKLVSGGDAKKIMVWDYQVCLLCFSFFFIFIKLKCVSYFLEWSFIE